MPGYIYVRSRAISSRTNENYDNFPADEIKAAWQTFIGRPVFVNHHNADISRARGVIIDAALHEDRYPSGQPDTWVEVLMMIDAVRFPKLAEAIVKGDIDRTSMGTAVAYTICSVCNHKAETPMEYCTHIARLKGQRVIKTVGGKREAVLAYEICHGLNFFENSLLVEDPADPTAGTFGVDTRGMPSLTRAAARKNDRFPPQKVGLMPEEFTKTAISHNGATTERKVDNKGNVYHEVTHNGQMIGKINKGSTGWDAELPSGSWSPVKNIRHGVDWLIDWHGRTKGKTTMAFRPMDTSDDPATGAELRTAALRVEAKPKWDDPSQHPWYTQHPIAAQNILDHWDRATDEDKAQGERWYPDAHLVAKAIGKGNATLGAGVLAAYSPQTLWPVNMFNAARAIEQGKGIGGPGSGIMATGAMAHAADRMINGEHHSQVLKGPKIQDFAHLIEHGGDQDPDQPHAVIDRHAMSVATGGRLSKADMEKAPTSTRHYYNHVVQAYKDAADQLSQREGRRIHPHQVQATTWLVRQRENALEDQAQGKPLDKGRERSRQKAQTDWEGYQGEHYPDLAGPGYYSATKTATKTALEDTVTDQRAPAQVDTLAPDTCPICRRSGTWNNGKCQVCGYEPPVEPFDAPDTGKAQEVDRQIGEPLDEEDIQPPLYVGQRSIPSTTVGKDDGMSNTPARGSLHNRLNDQQKRIGGLEAKLDQILAAVGVTAADVPPQFLDQQKGSGGDSDSDSVDTDSQDYKDGYADGKAGKDKSGSGTNYDAGYSAGKSAASDSSESDSDSDDSSKESSLRARRQRAYLAQKAAALHKRADDNVPTSNEQAREPAATESVDDIGASPAGANTAVTPDATTSLDSSPNTSTLADDDATTIDVENHPTSVDNPPSPDAAKAPVDVQAPAPTDNSTSFNTGNGVAWSAQGDPQTRIFTAMKLAKLRLTAGIAEGDELVLSQKIADSDLPLPVIQAVAQELSTVIEAARKVQAARGTKQHLVPQPATTTASRRTPSLTNPTMNGGIRASASLASPSSEEFGDLP